MRFRFAQTETVIQYLTGKDMHTLTLTQDTKEHTNADSILLKVSLSVNINLNVCASFLWRQPQISSMSFTSFPHFLPLLPPFPVFSFFFSSLQPLSNLPKYHNAFSFLFCFTCCVIDQCSPNVRTPSRLQRVIAGLGCGPVEPICSISFSQAKCRSGRVSEAKPTYVIRPVIPRWAAHHGVHVCVCVEEQVGGWFDKQWSHGWVLSQAAPG